MGGEITIAFDAMGSDHGAQEVVGGAALLSRQSQSIRSVLVGDPAQLERLLDAVPHDPKRLEIEPAVEVVEMNEDPRLALKAKRRCSVLRAAGLVAAGDAQAMVTAGNTGAAILACAESFKLVPGVRRAALAAVYPTERLHGANQDPFSLLLDVGATLHASAEDLVAFARLGTKYAQAISRNERPSVALLSNGAEAHKGPPAVVEAHALLREDASVNFVGNIEGMDIPRGTSDVVVSDGFTGNVVLKMLEGIGDTVLGIAQLAMREQALSRFKLRLLGAGLKRIRALTDWEQYGGAPILGFDKLCIKAHGRSHAKAIANAGKVAAKYVALRS